MANGNLTFRRATEGDVRLLAELNHHLIRDEGHRNPMNVGELEERMRNWLRADYAAILFEDETGVVAYALYRDDAEEVYLRHFFVVRKRRREGIGRKAMAMLFDEIWPKNKRLTVSVLTGNAAAIKFWRSVGYVDYCLTMERAK
jgi:predicted acetyltransferase